MEVFRGDPVQTVRSTFIFTNKYGKFTGVLLSWKTWSIFCDVTGNLVSPKNPARAVSSFYDSCNEEGPYIEIDVGDGPNMFVLKHGQYLFIDSNGKFSMLPSLDCLTEDTGAQ